MKNNWRDMLSYCNVQSKFFIPHSLFINDFHLLPYTLFVYGFEHFFDEVGIHTA